jgi:tetratricopeptide (TPR) repeat protein
MAFAWHQGNAPKAIAHAEECLSAAEVSEDTFAIGRSYYDLGLAWELAGELSRAATFQRNAVRWFQRAEASSWIYMALYELAGVLLQWGDATRAVPLLDEALSHLSQAERADANATTLCDPLARADILGLRAFAALAQDDPDLSTRLFAEKYDVLSDLNASRGALGALAGLAGIALHRNQPVRAARLLGVIDAAREAEGLAHVAHFQHVERLEIAVHSALGVDDYEVYWREGQHMPVEDAFADALAIAHEVTGRP